MQHRHIGFGEREFRFVEDVRVAQAQVVVFVEEAFLLHAGHVQGVKVADDGGQVADFLVGAAGGGVDAVEHVLGCAQFLG